MSEYQDQHTEPTPDMEAFYHKRFAEWDEEDAIREQEKPVESQDEQGNRIFTFPVATARRTERPRQERFTPDEEEDVLEAMLEANSNRSQKVRFTPSRLTEDPAAKQPVKDVGPLEEPVVVPEAEDLSVPAPESVEAPETEDLPTQPPISPADLLWQKEEPTGRLSPSEMIRRTARLSEERIRQEEAWRGSPITPADAVEQAQAAMAQPRPAPVKLHGEQFLTIPLKNKPKVTAPPELEPADEQPQEQTPAPPALETPTTQAAPQRPERKLPPPAAEKLPEPEEDWEEDDEPEEDEESSSRPLFGAFGRWVNAWFEERIEEQGRQIDADAVYEQEHPEPEKHQTGPFLSRKKKPAPVTAPEETEDEEEPAPEQAPEQGAKRKPFRFRLPWRKKQTAPETAEPAPSETAEPAPSETAEPAPSETAAQAPAQAPPEAPAPRRLKPSPIVIQLEPDAEGEAQSEPEEPQPEPPAEPAAQTPPAKTSAPEQAHKQAAPEQAAEGVTPEKAVDGPKPETTVDGPKPETAPKSPTKPFKAMKKAPAKSKAKKTGHGKQPTKPMPKVVRMPEERHGPLDQKLHEIKEHAEDFADTMFVAESAQRLEEEQRHSDVAKLIPATDEERAPRKRDIAREKRRQKAEEREHAQHRAPDTSPRELYRVFGASYKSQSARLPVQLLLSVGVLALSALAGGEVPFVQVPYLQENLRLTGLLLTLGLLLACVVGLDTLLEGVIRLLRRRPGLSTLCSIGTALAVIDGLWFSLIGRDGPLPFCGFAALSLWAVALGNVRKKQGLRDACEDAYTRSTYERLTMDEGKWSGKGVYEKEPGTAAGFGSQIQELDGAERVYRYAAPVMIAACLAFGILSAIGQRTAQMLIWNWSVIFVLATPLSATLAYGLPYARQVKRLRRAGAVLAGWDGVESLRGDAGIVLTDRDLFPDGCAQFLGIQNFGDVSLEKLTGCTASMVREADLGLARIFDDQIRIQGGFYRRVDQMDTSEEGGFTGVIRGDTVMIGTSGFLQVHGIRIEPGYQVKNAIFCVINDRLQGSFALSYALPRTVRPAIQTLLQGGITPILATRDFNIYPEVLRTRFKLPSERLQYPDVNRRFDLSARGQPHNKTLGALIFREGIAPYTDAILGGRRLHSVVLLNTLLTLAASVVGGFLGLYLTWVHAYQSLSLLNTLFFLVMWLVPTVVISNGVDQF